MSSVTGDDALVYCRWVGGTTDLVVRVGADLRLAGKMQGEEERSPEPSSGRADAGNGKRVPCGDAYDPLVGFLALAGVGGVCLAEAGTAPLLGLPSYVLVFGSVFASSGRFGPSPYGCTALVLGALAIVHFALPDDNWLFALMCAVCCYALLTGLALLVRSAVRGARALLGRVGESHLDASGRRDG